MTFKEIAEKADTENLFRIIFPKKLKNQIIKLIQKRLYEKGTTASGEKLRTDKAIEQGNIAYSDRTMLFKRADGKPLDRVTLKDTGDFYKSFKIEYEKLALEIDADLKKPEGESIAENFLQTYFPNEFFDEVTGLSDAEFKEILQTQMTAIKHEFLR